MSTESIVLILLSAAIHVGWNSLLKSSENPQTFALLKGSVLLVLALLVSPWIPFSEIPQDLWMFIILSGIIHTGYVISLSTAYETGDISFVYPIARSSPALVPVAAWWFIGEQLSLRGCLGIAVVVLCILALHRRPHETGATLRDILRRKDLVWALLTLSTVVAYTIVDKAGMAEFSTADTIHSAWRGPIYFLLENAICYGLFWIYMLVKGSRQIATTFRQEGFAVVGAATGTILSYSLILNVLQSEAASYVVTLRQSSVLIAVLAGTLFFKESQPFYRIAIAALMLVGFYLVSTA